MPVDKVERLKSKLMMPVISGLVICALACTVRADFLPGVYTYKLVLRDGRQGFAMRGTDGEKVSTNYKIEVYNAAGDKITTKVYDWALGDDRAVGCNCTVDVPVGEGAGYAKMGERPTLVVTTVNGDGREWFRSSKVLPPVGGRMGSANAPVGVFFGDAGDTDLGWDSWLRAVNFNSYLPSGASIGRMKLATA